MAAFWARMRPRRWSALDVAGKVQIQVFDLIAVFDAIFRARRLMLMAIILQRLGEAHRGQTGAIEGLMIAAASQAIQRKDQTNGVAAVNLFDGPGQFARRRIGVVLFTSAGKKSHAVRRARCGIGADDVIVQHAPDGVALLLGPRQHAFGSEQTLLFARNRGEKQRRAIITPSRRSRGTLLPLRARGAER